MLGERAIDLAAHHGGSHGTSNFYSDTSHMAFPSLYTEAPPLTQGREGRHSSCRGGCPPKRNHTRSPLSAASTAELKPVPASAGMGFCFQRLIGFAPLSTLFTTACEGVNSRASLIYGWAALPDRVLPLKWTGRPMPYKCLRVERPPTPAADLPEAPPRARRKRYFKVRHYLLTDGICDKRHIDGQHVVCRTPPDLSRGVQALPVSVHDKLLAYAELIERSGPTLGRPWADSLNGSRHRNMKELRFSAGGGTWRVAFAFDPNRRAILLAIGDKSKVEGKRFYRSLIAQADQRFDVYIENMGGKEV